jgi:hypothetical protein
VSPATAQANENRYKNETRLRRAGPLVWFDAGKRVPDTVVASTRGLSTFNRPLLITRTVAGRNWSPAQSNSAQSNTRTERQEQLRLTSRFRLTQESLTKDLLTTSPTPYLCLPRYQICVI